MGSLPIQGLAAPAPSAFEAKILAELKAVQRMHVDLGGYYQPDLEKVNEVMRPSECFNAIFSSL
jgi:isocitrate dehydrogenase